MGLKSMHMNGTIPHFGIYQFATNININYVIDALMVLSQLNLLHVNMHPNHLRVKRSGNRI